jgi:hypothetical protein
MEEPAGVRDGRSSLIPYTLLLMDYFLDYYYQRKSLVFIIDG